MVITTLNFVSVFGQFPANEIRGLIYALASTSILIINQDNQFMNVSLRLVSILLQAKKYFEPFSKRQSKPQIVIK